jgi:hypothetical protein
MNVNQPSKIMESKPSESESWTRKMHPRPLPNSRSSPMWSTRTRTWKFEDCTPSSRIVKILGGAGLSLEGDVYGDPLGDAEAKLLAGCAAMMENAVRSAEKRGYRNDWQISSFVHLLI